jgi:hypothetical protein
MNEEFNGMAESDRVSEGFIELGVKTLTKRQIEVLTLATKGKDIAVERGHAYVGHTRTSVRTVDALLRVAALKVDSSDRGCEYYSVNERGREILKRLGKKK